MKKGILSLTLVFIITLSAMLIPTVAADTTLESLIIDFEDGQLHGFYGNGDAKLTVTSEQAHSGKNSVLVSERTEGWHGAYLNVEEYVEPLYSYEITAWVLSKSKDVSGFLLSTSFEASNGQEFVWVDWQNFSQSDGWIKLNGHIIYPDNISFDDVQIYVTCTNPNAEYYIDDVSFKQISLHGTKSNARLPSLYEIYAEHFDIGSQFFALYYNQMPKNTTAPIIYRHFNALSQVATPFAHEKGMYTFGDTDEMFRMAIDKGILIHLPGLVWHDFIPDWLNKNTNGTPLTRAEAIQNMTDYIKNVVGHYAGKIDTWVVVNEAFEMAKRHIQIQDDWRDALYKDSPWYQAFENGADKSKDESGADYIEMAFRLAREADPNATLIYNETYMELFPYKLSGTVDMIKEINDKWLSEGNERLLIEAIGIQGHINLDANITDMEETLKHFINLGVKIHITEFDIQTIYEEESYENASLPTQQRYEKQAEIYAKMMILFKKYSKNIERVTFWGLSDNEGDSNCFYSLFDANYNHRLSYFAVADPEGYLAGNFDTEEKRLAWIEANSKKVIEIQVGNLIAKVNGNNVTLDQPAVLLPTGRNVIPARFIAENLGATVDWDGDTSTVIVTKGDTTILIQIDNPIAKINGKDVTLDQPAILLPTGRTVVPARFLAEALGATVDWDGETSTVIITYEPFQY